MLSASSLSIHIKALVSKLLLVSIVVGFLCISFVHTMPAHTAMDMGSAHNQHEHSATFEGCCGTSNNDHMELWKSTFVGITQSFDQILLLLTVTLFVTLPLANFLIPPRLSEHFISVRLRQYTREHPDASIYNPLLLAFAQGILHPKTF